MWSCGCSTPIVQSSWPDAISPNFWREFASLAMLDRSHRWPRSFLRRLRTALSYLSSRTSSPGSVGICSGYSSILPLSTSQAWAKLSTETSTDSSLESSCRQYSVRAIYSSQISSSQKVTWFASALIRFSSTLSWRIYAAEMPKANRRHCSNYVSNGPAWILYKSAQIASI